MTRILLLSLILATPLAAQETFFIERIEVRNARRVSADVVIAESLLREGRAYSEADLRDAATRLARLPFLLDVDFALEKGSERGQHVLVLTITETRPFFYLLDAQPILDANNDQYVEIDTNSRITSGDTMSLGFRWFVGRRGAVHVGFSASSDEREFTSDYASFAVGYTQYDLFGTRAFATLNLKKPIEGYGAGEISPQLVVGMPVSMNQTVTLQYDETLFERDTYHLGDVPVDRRTGERRVSARWSYNTTNDPFLPTRGTLLRVTPSVTWRDGQSVLYNELFQPVEVVGMHATILGLEAGASHNWELTDRNSIFGDLRGSWERLDERVGPIDVPEREARYGSIGLGITHSFWTLEERERGGDSRVELQLRYSNRTRHQRPYIPDYRGPGRDVRQVGAAWVRRSSWGTVRLGAGYAW